MIVLRALPAVLLAACAAGPRPLTQAEAAAPLEHDPPGRVTELETQSGFGTLEEGKGDEGVRALALRFVNVLADENVSQLRQLLGHATWQPGLARNPPADELSRRFAMLDFQTLRGAITQGAFESMQVRSVDATTWDVRLPVVSGPEPLFSGRPVLRIAREGEALAITSYGED